MKSKSGGIRQPGSGVNVALLAYTLECISECVSITDRENVILYVNDAFLHTYGYSREELIGRNIGIVRQQPSTDLHDEVLNETLVGGWQGELINRKKDGTEFVVFLSTSIITGDDGSFQGLVGVAKDITLQKKEDEAYRLLVDNALQGLLIVQDGHIAFANNKAAEILGYAVSDLMQLKHGSFENLIHPLDRKRQKEAYQTYAEGKTRDNTAELRFVTGRGEVRWVQLFSQATTYLGLPAIQLAFVDITDVKTAEFGYQRIQNQIRKQNLVLMEVLNSDPGDVSGSLKKICQIAAETLNTDRVSIWLFDEAETEISCMQLFDRRRGSEGRMQIRVEENPPYFEALSKNRIVAVTEVEGDQRLEGFSSYLKENNIRSMLDVRIGLGVERTGVVCWEECTMQRHWTEEEISFACRIVDVITFFLESGRRIATENALRESEQRLLQSNKTKDAFFSIIAHDLKSPYHAISGFADLLQNEYDRLSDEEKRKMIANIHVSANNTYKLLENLLAWASVQAGQMVVVRDIVDMSLLVNETLLLLKSQADLKAITFHSKLKFQTEAYADENMMKTVLRNVISNSVRYSYKNQRITISSQYVQQGGKRFLKMLVSDKGIGIREEDIGKIFDIGAKFVVPGSEGEKGTGLGLILAKEFLRMNEGEIWIESIPGTGTDVYLTIPVGPA
ncbi:MAG TPA: PAS domain S-box protein [Bacteroidales bacterium]|nr:PAS domain S-box protein [Bacteroidales bacterium]HSA44063.1 PAS domain S-box protein [Bacteroidales bacterium]